MLCWEEEITSAKSVLANFGIVIVNHLKPSVEVSEEKMVIYSIIQIVELWKKSHFLYFKAKNMKKLDSKMTKIWRDGTQTHKVQRKSIYSNFEAIQFIEQYPNKIAIFINLRRFFEEQNGSFEAGKAFDFRQSLWGRKVVVLMIEKPFWGPKTIVLKQKRHQFQSEKAIVLKSEKPSFSSQKSHCVEGIKAGILNQKAIILNQKIRRFGPKNLWLWRAKE